MLRKWVTAIIIVLTTMALFMTMPQASAAPQAVTAHISQAQAQRQHWITIRRGDTLSALARRYCGHANEFPVLAWANHIRNANRIYAGARLRIVCRHLARTRTVRGRTHSGTYRVSGGHLSYSGLERLWIAAGGARWAAPTAACIAEHESSGRQYAVGDHGASIGYWQINRPTWGRLATFSAYGNARAAITISHNGRDWSPWSTHAMCGV